MTRYAPIASTADCSSMRSTSDVRTRVNEQRRTPLVAEQVYRVLRALQDRGLVERVHIHDTSKAHWQAPGRAIRGGLMTEVAVHKPRSVRGTSDAGRGSQSERQR